MKTTPSIARGAREGPEPGIQPESLYHSLALPEVFKRMQQVAKPVILDLGPALGANVHALEHLHPRLYIADLFAEDSVRTRPQGVRAGPLGEQFWRWLFRTRPDEIVDVILAWDLFNYLTLAEITILRDHLRHQVAAGTLIFAIMAQGKEIPELPLIYTIRGDSTLAPQAQSLGRALAPRHREPELRRSLPGFSVDVSYLLRSGFQEYLLVYHPEEDAVAAPDKQPESPD